MSIVGPQYTAVAIGVQTAGSLVRLGGSPVSQLRETRRALRESIMRNAGLLAAADRPEIHAFVGQAEIRMVWSLLINTPHYGDEHSTLRRDLDTVVFSWCPKIDTPEDRAVFLIGLLPVTAEPPPSDGLWTFGGPNGYEVHVDPFASAADS